MKVLITGGTGLIGSSVVREALAEGYEVRVLKRSTSDLRNLEGLDIEFVDGDLLDPDSLDRALKGCRKLYQIAAIYRHWHPKGGDFIRRTNIEGTRNILGCALKYDLEKVIYTSSISSVGFYPDRLSTEDDFPEEKDCLHAPYRDSKFRSEKIAFEYTDKMPITIVNPASPIGVRDYIPTPTGRTILDFLNGKMFAYVDVGMNLIDVEDLAKGYILADKKGKTGERYILGNHNTFLKDFFEEIAKLTGLKAPSIKIPKPVIRMVAEVNEFIADITKIPPMVSIEQAVHTHYNEFVDCSKAVNELGLPQSDIRIAIHKAVKYYLDTGAVLPKQEAMIDLKYPM
ncbi:MAG: NAD-dependent epimerase/dehydratase family protein [Deltaproteobacteria bacterium]|nr:NAD-dependent epimerase/dehydratase family protein [Deltaproteobacteria bacterium]